MNNQYYHLCKECEHIFHCFDRETAENIKNDETKNLYLRPEKCNDFYPEF